MTTESESAPAPTAVAPPPSKQDLHQSPPAPLPPSPPTHAADHSAVAPSHTMAPHAQYANAHYYGAPMQQQSVPLYAPPYQYYHPHPQFYPPHPHVFMPWQQQQQQYAYYPPTPQHVWPQHDPSAQSQPQQATMSKHARQDAAQPPFSVQSQSQPLTHSRYAYGHQSPAAYAAASGHEDNGLSAQAARIHTSPARRSGGGRRRSSGGYTNGIGSTTNTPNKTRPSGGGAPGGRNNSKGEFGLDEAARELASAARDAVSRSDQVTIALLLTSWASRLEESGNASARTNGSADASTQPPFDQVFRASGALQICSQSLLFMDAPPDSAVQKALISLYSFVIYGTEALHRSVARAARRLAAAEDAVSSTTTTTTKTKASTTAESPLNTLVDDLHKSLAIDGHSPRHARAHAKYAAVHKVIDVLRNIADDVAAYNGILPGVASPTVNGSAPPTPAGPDPTKVVDRAMDAWRRACARLQGEIAVVVVLERAIATIPVALAAPSASPECVTAFYDDLCRKVLEELETDVATRRTALNTQWWTAVAGSEAAKVVAAIEERAAGWLAVVQRAVGEVDSALANMGLAFGPAQRVADDRLEPLVRCGAGVAAVIGAHESALTWCQATARTIRAMAVAFRALATTRDARYKPPSDAVAQFEQRVSAASLALHQVQQWEADAVLQKVLGCVQKSSTPATPSPPASISKRDVKPSTTTSAVSAAPKQKGIRFEEPPSSHTKSGGGTAGDDDAAVQKRRKPRHARMKSSPDELLHLNAHVDPEADQVEGATAAFMTGDSYTSEGSECSPVKMEAPESLASVIEVAANSTPMKQGRKSGGLGSELAVVYEDSTLVVDEEEEEDPEDKHIVVRDTDEEREEGDTSETEESPGKKRGGHSRSMSVDGIPSFGV